MPRFFDNMRLLSNQNAGTVWISADTHTHTSLRVQVWLSFLFPSSRRQAECAKSARIQMALPAGKPGAGTTNNLYEELGDNNM